MHFVMFVPGLPFNGETIARGLSLGGSESAAYYLARELAGRGHAVTVFGSIGEQDAGLWDGVRYLPAGHPDSGAPLGRNFEAFLASSPVDVVIGQRVPWLFNRPGASKVNLWWTHDLALKRHLPLMARQMWNVNAVLCVSEFHRQQVARIYGLDPERIKVVPNGVDASLFQPRDAETRLKESLLVYSSRPERGLEHLVGLDGRDEGPSIMELLTRSAP
ncbi:MAG: glycosyltransferase, partial [Deltaproteobacteria bacterium]|nr:glycosyltransferase [Deltaproteobacteria bacterium]